MSFRHALASLLLAQGNSPVLIENLPRWSKISMLDVYGHVMTEEKIAAGSDAGAEPCRKRMPCNNGRWTGAMG